MNPQYRRGRRLRGVVPSALAVMVASMAVLGAGAPAQAGTYYNVCGQRTTSQPFVAQGDFNEYFLPQGSTFETASPSGWVTSKASIVTGNEPFFLTGNRSDTRSLGINDGGSAVTEVICIAAGEDSVRFAYRGPGVQGASLRVDITVISALGTASTAYSVSDSAADWKISPRLPIPNLVDYTGAQSLIVRFTDTGSSAPWRIDDVFVDPWRTR